MNGALLVYLCFSGASMHCWGRAAGRSLAVPYSARKTKFDVCFPYERSKKKGDGLNERGWIFYDGKRKKGPEKAFGEPLARSSLKYGARRRGLPTLHSSTTELPYCRYSLPRPLFSTLNYGNLVSLVSRLVLERLWRQINVVSRMKISDLEDGEIIFRVVSSCPPFFYSPRLSNII